MSSLGTSEGSMRQFEERSSRSLGILGILDECDAKHGLSAQDESAPW